DEVRDLGDHPADLRTVGLGDGVPDPAQTEGAQRAALALLRTDRAADLGDDQLLRHHAPAFRFASILGGSISSSSRSRSRATSSGRCSAWSAATVAWTTLMGLDVPSDFASTSEIPAHSRTARTGPPAITPVPGAAGLSTTLPAPCSPMTACTIV